MASALEVWKCCTLRPAMVFLCFNHAFMMVLSTSWREITTINRLDMILLVRQSRWGNHQWIQYKVSQIYDWVGKHTTRPDLTVTCKFWQSEWCLHNFSEHDNRPFISTYLYITEGQGWEYCLFDNRFEVWGDMSANMSPRASTSGTWCMDRTSQQSLT